MAPAPRHSIITRSPRCEKEFIMTNIYSNAPKHVREPDGAQGSGATSADATANDSEDQSPAPEDQSANRHSPDESNDLQDFRAGPATEGERAGEDQGEEEEDEEADEHMELGSAIPAEYAPFLGKPQIFWHEDARKYHALRNILFAEHRPQDMTDCITVNDLVGCEWELERLRTLKTAAIYRALPLVSSEELSENKGDGILALMRDQSLIENSARAAAPRRAGGEGYSQDARLQEVSAAHRPPPPGLRGGASHRRGD